MHVFLIQIKCCYKNRKKICNIYPRTGIQGVPGVPGVPGPPGVPGIVSPLSQPGILTNVTAEGI